MWQSSGKHWAPMSFLTTPPVVAQSPVAASHTHLYLERLAQNALVELMLDLPMELVHKPLLSTVAHHPTSV